MQLRLQKLQDKNNQAWKIKIEQLDNANWQDVKGVLHYQGFFYVLEIIKINLISTHHDNLLAGHFGIEIIDKLIAWKYY